MSFPHSHSLLQRTATPITPDHSPHPSLNSSYSPGGTLSLHEYRKQQATPSPPAVSGSTRQIKRRAGASSLNKIERIDSVQSTPSQEATESFPSFHRSDFSLHLNRTYLGGVENRPSPTTSQPHSQPASRVQSPPTHSQTRSPAPLAPTVSQLASSQSHFQFHPSTTRTADPASTTQLPSPVRYIAAEPPIGLALQSLASASVSSQSLLDRLPPQAPEELAHLANYPSTDSAEGFYRSGTRLREFAKSFKPTKRLPRPHTSNDTRPRIPSPLRSDDSLTNLLSVSSPEGLTSTSSVSLSRFPFPKPPLSAPPFSTSNAPLLTLPSFGDTSPGPTVLHYRGASFDLVNPHTSLQRHNIETPVEGDRESIEYLRILNPLDYYSGPDMAPIDSADSDYASVRSEKPAPPRAVYADFHSAYNSITTRARSANGHSAQDINVCQQTDDLDAPPLTPSHPPDWFKIDSDNSLSPSPLTSSRPPPDVASPRSPGFLKRVSSVFHRKKDSARQERRSTNEHETEMLPMPGSRVSGRSSAPMRYSTIQSAPFFGEELERDIEVGRGAERILSSDGDLAYLGYDEDSMYPSTILRPRPSSSVYPESIMNRQSANRTSTPFGFPNAETDYSSDIDVHSYLFEYANSAQNSRHVSHSSSGNVLEKPHFHSQHPNHTGGNKEGSTLSHIYDEYHNGELSNTSLFDLIQQESNETIRMSAADLGAVGGTARPLPAPLTMTPHDSLRTGSQGSSAISSPRTPESSGFPLVKSRLLRASAGVPPNVPLPLQPPVVLERPRPLFARRDRELSDMMSHGSSNDYGDTRHLLQMSSADVGQPLPSQSRMIQECNGGVPKRASQDNDQRLADLRLSNSHMHSSPPVSPLVPQDRMIGQDLKRLSQMSGISNLSGSVYVLNNDGNPKDRPTTPHHEPGFPEDWPLTSHHRSRRSKELNDPKEDESLHETPRSLGTASRKDGPSGIPRMWRKHSGGRLLMISEPADPPNRDSYADVDDEDDERDWETVGDASRPTLARDQTEGSIADCSNYSGLSLFKNAQIHPGNFRYQHSYKLQRTPDSNEDILVPSYQFAGTGFPNRNALTPPLPATASYRHPSPLAPDHTNPFASSPPQVTLISSPHRNFVYDDEPIDEGTPEDKSKYEGTPPQTRPGFSRDYPGTQGFSPDTYTGTTGGQGERIATIYLSSEPHDEILYNDGHPLATPTREGLLFGASPLASPLEDQSSPLPSITSPMSDTERIDSFSKLVILGPKGNLTGTPEGTNMREAGSSLADSSSPGATFGDSTRKPFESSPLGLHQSRMSQDNMADVPSPSNASALKLARGTRGDSFSRYGPAGATANAAHVSKASGVSSVTTDKLLEKERLDAAERKARMEAIGRRASEKKRKRASVRCQKGLKEMMLSPSLSIPSHSNYSLNSQNTHMSHFLGSDVPDSERPMSGDTNAPFAHVQFPRESQPQLLPYPRPQSSVLSVQRKRKQRLSWIIFAMVFWFPPFLVLYHLGFADFLMLRFSQGEIEKCGRFQKKVALWTGVVMCTSIPAAAIIVLVLFHLGIV